MTVGDLIDKLSKFDRGLPVHCWCEDDDLTAPFDINEVSKADVVRSRDEDTRKPLISFSGGDNSEPAVIIEITTVF